MAKIINIPDSDHVLRWARPKEHLLREHGTKKIIGCDHALFKLRTDDKFVAKHGGAEKSLSINHVEHFKGTAEEALKSTVLDYKNGLASLSPTVDLPKKSVFAKLNVGDLKSLSSNYGAKIRVVHDASPKACIKSHGSINQLPQDNTLLFEDLCKLAFKNLMEAEPYLN